jgi:ferrous iron transport protein B
MIIICGIILKKTKLLSGDPAPFVMELPQYHIPSLKGVLMHMWERSKHLFQSWYNNFASCIVVWFLQSFNWSLALVDTEDSS